MMPTRMRKRCPRCGKRSHRIDLPEGVVLWTCNFAGVPF
jgi:hypothetical protein